MNSEMLDAWLHIQPFFNGTMIITVMGLCAKLIIDNRKTKIENRKLTIEENAGLRKEFLDEMHSMRDQLGGLRDDNDKLRGEVRSLRAENDNLRTEVRGLHAVIDGLRRETQGAAISAQRVVAANMPGGISSEMQNALNHLELITTIGAPVDGQKSESL